MSIFHPFHEFPKHMYHEGKDPLVVQNATDEAAALADGYTHKYAFKEFPKMVDGVVANNADEESAIKAKTAAAKLVPLEITKPIEPEVTK
jgi:hypothetical protein